jgi:hypothetical protein
MTFGGGWVTFEDRRDQVPFEVGDGLRALEVDADALDDGLVVIPRESVGTAADLPDRVPAHLPPTTPVRAIIEQVSAVEHAIVIGVPVATPDGGVRITAGRGRPLILSTLEVPEAMRVIGGGHRGRALLVVVALAAGVGLSGLGIGWLLVSAVTGGRW